MDYKTKSILLIDDDQDDRFFFAKALEDADREVQLSTANDGVEAFEKLQFLNPDLILLDLEMPGMNGMTFLKKIKADRKLRDIPVIVYTAALNMFDVEEMLELGAYQVVIKPIDFDNTVEIIRRILSISFIRMSA